MTSRLFDVNQTRLELLRLRVGVERVDCDVVAAGSSLQPFKAPIVRLPRHKDFLAANREQLDSIRDQ